MRAPDGDQLAKLAEFLGPAIRSGHWLPVSGLLGGYPGCKIQDFCTPSAMSQKGGELTFPGLLTALTLTAMGRLPKVLLTMLGEDYRDD